MGPTQFCLGKRIGALATLVLTSLPLAVVMLVMLRHAAPLWPAAITHNDEWECGSGCDYGDSAVTHPQSRRDCVDPGVESRDGSPAPRPRRHVRAEIVLMGAALHSSLGCQMGDPRFGSLIRWILSLLLALLMTKGSMAGAALRCTPRFGDSGKLVSCP